MSDDVHDDGSGHISRRNLIKKGAIVGGAAWVTPVVVGSIASPAAAESLTQGGNCIFDVVPSNPAAYPSGIEVVVAGPDFATLEEQVNTICVDVETGLPSPNCRPSDVHYDWSIVSPPSGVVLTDPNDNQTNAVSEDPNGELSTNVTVRLKVTFTCDGAPQSKTFETSFVI